MFERSDPITPTLGGHTWFEKPVLLYWMMMASFKAFGVSEWAARLGPAISGLLTILAVWWIGRLIELKTDRPRLAFLATLVIASSAGLIVFSRGASFDIVITMTLTWTLCFFLAYLIESRHRNLFLAGFYCCAGLSLLAKGLIGVVLPAGIIGLFYLLRRRLPDRALMISLLWGAPLTLLVAALWYGPVIARHGWPFIDEFFIQHHFARYFSNKYQHPQPVYFYLLVVLLLALPWTVFMIESLIKSKGWRWRGEDAIDQSRTFALVWFVVPIVFFSFSGSKLPAYILPSLPAAALLVGERLYSFVVEPAGKTTMRLTAVLFLLLGLAGLVYAHQTQMVTLQCAVLVVSPAIVAGSLLLVPKHERFFDPLMTGFASLAIAALALHCVVDRFAPRESVRELLSRADAAGYSESAVLMFNRIDRTAEFYAAGRVVYGPDGDPIKLERPSEVLDQVRKAGRPLLFIVPLGSKSHLEAIQGVQTKVIADNGRNAVVAVSAQ